MVWLKRIGWVALALLALLGLLLYCLLVPRQDPRPLPPGLIAVNSPEGKRLLAKATARRDYAALARAHEPQELTSFCGAASSVIVLKAGGRPVTQATLFNDAADEVRPRWRVAVGGMTLDVLEGILDANDAAPDVHRASSSSESAFREAVRRNLAAPGDFMLVNYQREALGQEAVGHISPLGAYDAASDRVLILDTASYKYPYTWVPVRDLFRAMNTIDSETGKSRGWIEVGFMPADHAS